jgi:hypothetical protein
MAKLGRQGCQVRKVEKSLDGSGFGSSVPRCSSCFMGGGGFATERRKVKVVSRAGARVVGYSEQSRYAISNRIGTAASMLQHRAENLRRAGHAALKKTLINDH